MIPAAVWLIHKNDSLKKWFSSSRLVKLFGLYILLHVVMGTWALMQHETNASALIYSFIINLRFIGFFILCSVVVAGNDFLRRHWKVILLAPAGVVIIFGLLQRAILPYDFLRHFGYGPSTIPAYQTIDNDLSLRRIQSTLRGANPLGAYLVLVIPALFLRVVPLGYRLIRLMGLVGGSVVLFFTYSRSAFVGLVASLVFLVYLSARKYINAWLVYGFITLVLVVGAGAYLLRHNTTAQDTILHTSSSSTSSVTSNEARLQAVKAGALDVIHQPLGRGVGTAGPASFRNTEHQPRIAENYFLQIGQEVGVLGIAIFISINALVIKQLWRSRQQLLAKILLASFAGITFVNLVSHAWTDDTLAYLWWGLAGIASAPAILKHENTKK